MRYVAQLCRLLRLRNVLSEPLGGRGAKIAVMPTRENVAQTIQQSFANTKNNGQRSVLRNALVPRLCIYTALMRRGIGSSMKRSAAYALYVSKLKAVRGVSG